MNKYFKFITIFLLLFSLSIPHIRAQTTFASEDELKKQAAKLFEEEAYEKATPLYSQLVSNYLKDANYNYRLGVCLLFTNADKEKCISYLELAVNKTDVEKEAHYYLGMAYHLNYRFDDAILQYQAYMRLGQAKNIEKFQVQRQMEMCVNGKKLLQNLSDLQVTEKKEMNREDFFRSYDISTIGGKLLVKPEEKEFKTPLDKKKKEQSIIYLAKDKNQVYFSSYGQEGGTGKDIYVTNRTVSGEWAKPQLIGSFVNTKYDEDFPFLHPNGKVLYFSSKGHTSMGGYDIFKSQYNELTKSWGPPQNMDFPINTPDDDILYVTDSSEKEAYFSSARNSVSGKISVYHINVDRKPLDVVIIKGNVVKNHNNQALDVKITVKDLATNNILGMYSSSAENGAYSLELPNGGSFSFTVESPGFPTQSDVVIVPVQYKFNPMKQEITYDLVTSRLKIKNSFGGTNEDENYLLALNYIKNKSKMEVSLVDLSPVDSSGSDAPVDSTDMAEESAVAASDKKLSNEDIIKIAYEDAKDVDAEAKELREQADIALNLANQKNELAQVRSNEAAAFMAEAQNATDITKKEEFFDKSDAANTEAKKLNQETVIAYNLAKKLENTAFKKQEEADVSQLYAKELETAVQQGSTPQALAKVEVQEKKLEELNRDNQGVSSITNNLKVELDTKQRELNKAIQNTNDIKQEMLDNETVIANLKLDLEKTKNEELKQGLDNQIAELGQENAYKKNELAKNEEKVAKLQKEYEVVSNETAMVNAVVSQSKTESSETASAGVATIDKNKLEQQVNSIAGVTPTSAKSEITPNTVVSSTTPAVKNTDTTPPVGSTETPPAVVSTTKPASTTTGATPVTKTETTPAVVSTTKPSTATSGRTTPVSTKTETTPAVVSTTKPSTSASEIEVPANTKPATTSAGTSATTIVTANTPDIAPPVTTKPETAAAVVSTSTTTTTVTDQAIPVTTKSGTTPVIASATSTVVATPEDEEALRDNPYKAAPPKQIANELISLNKKNEPELAAAEKIENPAEREKAKAVVLQKWAKEIEADRVKLQQVYDTTGDFVEKQNIAEKINELAVSSKEKRTMADESLAVFDSLKQSNPELVSTNNSSNITAPAGTTPVITTITNTVIASTTNIAVTTPNNIAATTTTNSNTSANPTSVVTDVTTPDGSNAITKDETPQSTEKPVDPELEKINKANEADMAVVETIENKKDREKARVAALKMWSEEVNAHTAVLEKDYKNTTDTAKKNALAQQIAASKKSSSETTPTGTTKPSDNVSSGKPVLIGSSTVVLLPDEVFERRSTPAYSEEKPIPVNEQLQLPEGIIYKVQIGAFRKPIAQNLFVGISPITGERTPQGFIRYTAGIFKSRNTAESIKNEIKSLGYKDAFVVAFKDGKRIPMNEANAASPEIAGNNGTTVSGVKTDIAAGKNETAAVAPASEEQKDIAPTENVTTVGGLFYTVQVGVFAQAVPSAKLFNIQPLYTETAPNGNLRYNIGVYNNLARAAEAKAIAVDAGIKDAFITAYYNGKRISMTEAKQYEYEGGVEVFSKAPNVNALPYIGKAQQQSPVQSTPANDQQPSQDKAPEASVPVVTDKGQAPSIKELQSRFTDIKREDTNSQIYASTFATDVVFKVQVGAFRNEVPLEIVNKFLKISKYGVENYVDISGLTIYTAGDFKTYEEANKVKQELASDIFQDAFVVAYRNGKKISMDEAKK